MKLLKFLIESFKLRLIGKIDINRLLFGLQIVLCPGRFIAVTFVQVLSLMKGEYK